MVEGHSVHRVARAHTRKLVGRLFKATSPNGRFTEGAKLIDGREMAKVEAVGKNLFAWFGGPKIDGRPATVMHVHFGMSGRWAVFDAAKAPDPTPTTRLRLETGNIVSHLSAMTVAHGDDDLYLGKKAKLGEDGLREDADPEALWERVKVSKKSIGKLLMDQAFFAGVGNIYRAEILFKAGVHPEILGEDVTREEFNRIWNHTVSLLRRGFQCGSILTVDKEEAIRLGKPNMRRYIYNQKRCGRCGDRVISWTMAARTCYACPSCQPLRKTNVSIPDASEVKVFNSHCARESLTERISTPQKLRVSELKAELKRRGLSTSGRKKELVERLSTSKWKCVSCGFTNLQTALMCIMCAETALKGTLPETVGLLDSAHKFSDTGPILAVPGTKDLLAVRSAVAASLDKMQAGEKLNVEHVADLDLTAEGKTVDWTDLHGDRNGRGFSNGVMKMEVSDSKLFKDEGFDTKEKTEIVTPKLAGGRKRRNSTRASARSMNGSPRKSSSKKTTDSSKRQRRRR